MYSKNHLLILLSVLAYSFTYNDQNHYTTLILEGYPPVLASGEKRLVLIEEQTILNALKAHSTQKYFLYY